MRFVLIVEGQCEAIALPSFIKRCIQTRTSEPITITTIKRKPQGAPDLIKNVVINAHNLLKAPKAADLTGVISLIDLATDIPLLDKSKPIDQRIDDAKYEIESKVDRPKFRQFFIVHELEAWLMADPSVFRRDVQNDLIKALKTKKPEQINDKKPPSKLLDELYFKHAGHRYDQEKIRTATMGFQKLDPQRALNICPYLNAIVSEMLTMAQAAGL